MSHQYSEEDIAKAVSSLCRIGGGPVFSHVGMGLLGLPQAGMTGEQAHQILLRGFRSGLGEERAWCIPTYTYSYCRREVYDPVNTPSHCGDFSELFRQLPKARRSLDPIFSVAIEGDHADRLLEKLPHDCFGQGCLYERLLESDGVLCNVGVGFPFATFVHYLEQRFEVPYRYRKLFPGNTLQHGKLERNAWIYFVAMLGDYGLPDLRRLEEIVRREGLLHERPLGRGSLTAIRFRDLYEVCAREIQKDPCFLAKTKVPHYIRAEETRVGKRTFPISEMPVPEDVPSLAQLLGPLPRDSVSDGFDAALDVLARILPMKIHEYPSGLPCWSWIMPEKWGCHEAYLERMNGERVFSYAECPLHVVSYSLPFEGVVSKEELFRHLHTHWELPDATPFVFKYWERDWGLCCSKDQKDTLQDPEYRVVIRSHFSYGNLKVGESILPGKTERSFLIAAHLCHPNIVQDGLLGVLAGLELMRWLQTIPERVYTYQFCIFSETIGSVAYLSQNQERAKKLFGGIVTEMLGHDYPHFLHLSAAGDTEVDRIFSRSIKHFDPSARVVPFNGLNDERHFNAPGVEVPVLGFYRYRSADNPYPSYHSSADTAENVDWAQFQRSIELLKNCILSLEQEKIPTRRVDGELFLSRYGLPPEGYANVEARTRLYEIMYQVNGKRGITSIAENLGRSLSEVQESLSLLESRNLIYYPGHE